jgi:hypothetical protein
MTKEWFTAAEIAAAALPEMPKSHVAVANLATREGWQHQDGKCRKVAARGGGWEYHISLLPRTAQTRLMMLFAAPANDAREPARDTLWQRYDALPAKPLNLRRRK